MIEYDDEIANYGSRFWRDVSLRDLGIPGAETVSIVRINSRIQNRVEHTHSGCVELIYCLRGERLKCASNGHIDTLSPHEVFVSFPGERHCIFDGPKGRFSYALRFRLPRRGQGIFGLSAYETALLVRRLKKAPRIFAVSDLAACFQRILQVCDDAEMAPEERTLRVRHALVSILLGVCDAAGRGVRAVKTSGCILRGVVAEMERNPLGNYPLDELCARLGMSKSSFIAKFKSMTGSTPHAYLLRQRIERAKALLKTGRAISSIADELGFSSLPHFSRVFREIVGESPSFLRT